MRFCGRVRTEGRGSLSTFPLRKISWNPQGSIAVARSQGIRPSTAHRPRAGCGLAHVVFPNPVRSEPRRRRRGKRGCVGHCDVKAPAAAGDVTMSYQIAPLFCRPWTLLGITPKLIESHYENNYGGAFTRLNAICAELEALDP